MPLSPALLSYIVKDRDVVTLVRREGRTLTLERAEVIPIPSALPPLRVVGSAAAVAIPLPPRTSSGGL